jgi:predicted dehydrogenase
MKVAVLGAGGMGYGVALGYARRPGVDEVIAMDINPDRLRSLQGRERIRTTTNLAEALDDPAVKLALITASNDAHYPLAMAAFAAGKAVLCEKPIANTLADARRMVEEAERRGLFFQIGFELRYSRLYTQVKEWIDAGLLGQVVNTQCTYLCSEFHHKGSWRNRKASGGSMFGEKLCHYVDLPRWWIGSPVTEVYTACAPNVVPYYEVRDNYHTTYRFANGAVSQLTFVMYVGETFAGDPLQNVVTQQQGDGHQLTYLVVGTKGAAATDVFYRTLKRWEFGDSPKCMTSRLVETRTWDAKDDSAWFHNGDDQHADILRRVANGLPPMTPARDAYETMRLVFAAEQSADTGQPIELTSEG